MPDPIADALLAWHDFFIAVTTIAGTLIGLLFVVIGLNLGVMADTGHQGMRVLTGQTFRSFLFLILIGVLGFIRIVRDVRLARTDPDPAWSGRGAITRVISPALAYGMALYVALGIWRQDVDVLDWFVGIVLLLTISAATSCWDLMEEIANQRGAQT